LPTPQGISQAPTSFIGFWCQGIHQVPLKTCHQHTNTNHTQQPPPPQRTAEEAQLWLVESHREHQHTNKKMLRVHYAVLKKQPPDPEPPPKGADQAGDQKPHPTPTTTPPPHQPAFPQLARQEHTMVGGSDPSKPNSAPPTPTKDLTAQRGVEMSMFPHSSSNTHTPNTTSEDQKARCSLERR
jgi:hypothetical protein